jgi:hypothetical protein
MRRALVLALCCCGAGASPAGAASVDLPTRPAAPGAAVSVVDPVFTADGGVVFGAAPTPARLTIFRIDPGSARPRALTTLAIPNPKTFLGLYVRLVAAGTGGGFMLDQHQSRGLHGGFSSMEAVKLTFYPVPGGAGIALPDCDWGCQSGCPPYPASVAADSASVLIAPVCGAATPPDPMVYDIATGTTHEVPSLPDEAHIAGHFVSGVYPGSDGGGVMDWTTGELVRTAAEMTQHALLDDGTLLFTEIDSPVVLRYGPGDAEPVPMGAQGTVVDVAGGRLLTTDGAGTYHVWSLDGTDAARFDGVRSAVAFDGRRLAFLETACMTTRLQVWELGAPRPDQLPPRCGAPRPAARASMRHRTARVILACPISEPEGCMGTAGMTAPRAGLARPFSIRPGKHASLTLAARIGARRCRALMRARTWRVQLATPIVYGTATRTIAVRPPQRTRSVCAR